MSQINSKKRNLSACQISGCPEKSAVPSEYQNAIHILPHFRIVGILSLPDQTFLSVRSQILCNLPGQSYAFFLITVCNNVKNDPLCSLQRLMGLLHNCLRIDRHVFAGSAFLMILQMNQIFNISFRSLNG